MGSYATFKAPLINNEPNVGIQCSLCFQGNRNNLTMTRKHMRLELQTEKPSRTLLPNTSRTLP